MGASVSSSSSHLCASLLPSSSDLQLQLTTSQCRTIQLKMLDVWPQPGGTRSHPLARTLQMMFEEPEERDEQHLPSDDAPSMLRIGCMVVVMSHLQALHLLTSARLADVLACAQAAQSSLRSAWLHLLLYCARLRIFLLNATVCCCGGADSRSCS